MRLAVPFALLLAVGCGSSTSSPGVDVPVSPPSSDPPPSQDATPPAAPIQISLPPDAVPWTPAPVDSGGGAARCDRGETLPTFKPGAPCTMTPGSLPAPTRVPFASPTPYGCGAPLVNAAGTLLVHESIHHCCGYDDEYAMVLQPDLTWAFGALPHWPLAVGLGTDGFLIAGGEPGSVTRILAYPDATTARVSSDVRVPFPLAFFLPSHPWGYEGPFGAWPDGNGGLLVAGTGAELDRTVALGLAHLDASGALVAGPIRVASTETPLETSPLLVPLAAGVDGAGRILVVWADGARCEDSYARMSFAARWYCSDGAPLGDTFNVSLDDWPIGMMRLADGSLALTTERGWLAARFADGRRGVGPVPAAFATRDARRLVRIPGGFANVEPPCAHPDRRGRVEVLAASGASCGVVALPPLETCLATRRYEDDLVVGPDGTIAEREPDFDFQSCAFRLWPRAVAAP